MKKLKKKPRGVTCIYFSDYIIHSRGNPQTLFIREMFHIFPDLYFILVTATTEKYKLLEKWYQSYILEVENPSCEGFALGYVKSDKL